MKPLSRSRFLPLRVFLPLLLSACALIGSPGPTTVPVSSATQLPALASTPLPAPTYTPIVEPGPADTQPPNHLTTQPATPPTTQLPILDVTPTAVVTEIGAPTPAPVSSPPDPNAYLLRKIVSGLDEPLYLTHGGDGSGRLFVVEQPGRIRLLKDGALLPEPFLDLSDLVNDSANEQGLLGLAFSPRYATDGQFFVNYTDQNGDSATARYSVSAANPDQADAASAKVLLRIEHPVNTNHNGGDLVFGPDGYLYFGMGDGGGAGDPKGNGQRLDTLLGKMLRIDVGRGDPYAIPPDNPFVGRPDARPEIWAYGLRNPWRFSFDRATHDLYIGDVGQNEYEEIDFQPAGSPGGENYGWNLFEGSHPYAGGSTEGLTPPIAEYSHAEGGCSVTGGYVYRGALLPALTGVYLFGDYCSGQVWASYRTASGWQTTAMFNTFFNISSLGEDADGELYFLDHRGGAIYQLVAAP